MDTTPIPFPEPTARQRRMRVEHHEFEDTETGEVNKVRELVAVQPRRTKKKPPKFGMVMVELPERMVLNPIQWPILLLVLCRTNVDTGTAPLTIAAVARTLDAEASYVGKQMRDLVARRLVRKAKNGEWQVSPFVGFVGLLNTWEDAKTNWGEPVWTR